LEYWFRTGILLYTEGEHKKPDMGNIDLGLEQIFALLMQIFHPQHYSRFLMDVTSELFWTAMACVRRDITSQLMVT
jgi:hypothetical protein